MLAFGLALASARVALAAGTVEIRIAVLDPDPKLLDAIAVSLSAWGLHVVGLSSSVPAPDVASATKAARGLAREQNAGAVVWITPASGGVPSLWLYDAQTEQVSVRPLSQVPPFDEAAAAAVALSVKTLLRSTSMAPPPERTTADAPPTSTPPAPTLISTPPLPTAALPPQPTVHSWHAEVFGSGHFPTGASAPIVPRVGVGVSVWPRSWRERVGFGADVRASTGLDIAGSTFVGTFDETMIGVSARARLAAGSLCLELASGSSLHVTSLAGTVLTSSSAKSIGRADASIDVAAVPELSLGARVRLGALLETSILLRHQRYVLGSETVLRMATVGFDLGVRTSLVLD